MIEQILIDTDVIIDHLRGVEEARKLLKAVEEGHLSAYLTITEAVIYSGKKMEGKAEQRRAQLLLDLMYRADVNGAVAKKAGRCVEDTGLRYLTP